jgi:hypothetical protein
MPSLSEQDVDKPAHLELELRRIRLQERELVLRRAQLLQELELKRVQLTFEFAKFGFAGTLGGGIAGMVLILALVVVDMPIRLTSTLEYGASLAFRCSLSLLL